MFLNGSATDGLGAQTSRLLGSDTQISNLDDAAENLVDKQLESAVDDSVEKIILNDDLKRKFVSLTGQVVRLYKAILPDPRANEFAPVKNWLAVLAEKIRLFTETPSIDEVMDKVGQLLDESVATVGYVIHSTEETSLVDLSEIDFEALKAHFEKGRKRTEAEKLKALIESKLVLDWRKKLRTRADVYATVKTILDDLPRAITPDLYLQKCDTVFQHVYDSYIGEGRGVYEVVQLRRDD